MHRVEFTYKHKRYNKAIASTWNELTRSNLLFLSHLFVKKMDAAVLRSQLVFYFLGVKPSPKLQMNTGELLEIMKLQDFLFETECDLTTFLIDSFRLRFGIIKYYGPGNFLEHSTVAEIAYADSYLQKYIIDKDDQSLCMVIAALYRPSNPWRWFRHLIYGDDIRSTFNDKIAIRRAKRFKKLADHYKQAIYLQFKGCRTMDVRNNPELHAAADEAGSSLGWAGLIINMAGPEIGTIENVEVMSWRNAMIFLKKIEIDRQRMEAQFTNKNN